MFGKVLIANRGEIACRIMRTCKRLGIRTVAVYSEPDADALHVGLADEAWPVGPAEARHSYLDIAAILRVAKASGAEAIHPGYGFLSERAEFAEACAEAGVVFVGPPAAAIRAMGGKSEAKALMEAAGVPVVPGYHGAAQDDATLAAEARRIGWPVLIKASAGGGGKGMKVAQDASTFARAVESARREAAAAFGDDRLLLERYVGRARHVEVQVFADSLGGCIYLLDRDCSIQRRHQKVVEEAPAPGLAADLRRRMGEAAVAAARAVGYVGAGTIEFLLDADGSFYFMEMNTRLQVEHPVTEAITGQDLVAWQLAVAAGEPLPLRQDEVVAQGHAVEVRLYAEDPAREFLPQTGRLTHLVFPAEDRGLRVDTGVRQGDSIGIHYDPMIAKLIAHGADRPAAIRRLGEALQQTEVVGLATNLRYLRSITAHPAFVAGDLDTRFVERHAAELLAPPPPATAETIMLATAGLLQERAAAVRAAAARSPDPFGPWGDPSGWRMNLEAVESLAWRDGERVIATRIAYTREGWRIGVDGAPAVTATATRDAAGRLEVVVEGVRRRCGWARDGSHVHVFTEHGSTELVVVDPLMADEDEEEGEDRVVAPMPGRVTALMVAVGDAVADGQGLLVLEAMKMEHTLKAPRAGRIAELRCAVGEQVMEGAVLVRLEAP